MQMRSRSPYITIPRDEIHPSSSHSSSQQQQQHQHNSSPSFMHNSSAEIQKHRVKIIVFFVVVLVVVFSLLGMSSRGGSDLAADSHSHYSNAQQQQQTVSSVNNVNNKAAAGGDPYDDDFLASVCPSSPKNSKGQEIILLKAQLRQPASLPCFSRLRKSIDDQRAAQEVVHSVYHSKALTVDASDCDLRSCRELALLLTSVLAPAPPTSSSSSSSSSSSTRSSGAVLDLFGNVNNLDLSRNKLQSDDGIPIPLLKKMKLLSMLFLSSNQFTRVPAGLQEVSTVTRLSLKSNKITSVDAATQLPSASLIHLILTDNKISEISNFGILEHVRKLMLAGNELTSLADLFKPYCTVNAQYAVGYQRQQQVRISNDERIIRPGGGGGDSSAPSCTRMRALELLRAARNKLQDPSGIQGFSDTSAVPNLKWISFAANPITSTAEQQQQQNDDETNNNIVVGSSSPSVPDVTAKVRRCFPKKLGGGASGIVVKCLYNSLTQGKGVVLKFFKAVSSDGGDKAELAALKALMSASLSHFRGGKKRLLLPLGLADFGDFPSENEMKEMDAAEQQRGGGGGDNNNNNNDIIAPAMMDSKQRRQWQLKRQREVCADFPMKQCPSRFAAVFPLIPGHTIAVPPDILTVTQAQYPISLYTKRELFDRSEPALRDRIPMSCLTMVERYRIVHDIVEAVAAMHEAGVIHGDIYGHNIFAVAEEGGVLRGKLLDFGASFMFPGAKGGHAHYFKYEARAIGVFASEMLDPRRIPLCHSKFAPKQGADAIAEEFAQRHGEHQHHQANLQAMQRHQQQQRQHPPMVVHDVLEKLAMDKLAQFVHEATGNTYTVSTLLDLPCWDAKKELFPKE